MRLFLTLTLICTFLPCLHGQEKTNPTTAIFAPTTPLATFKVVLDEANTKKIRQDPRSYVHATLIINGKKYEDVGVKIKGAAGSFRNWDDRPALTINMDKFIDGGNYQNLDKLHLNNSVQDGSYMNELISSLLAIKMGLPTARTTHAVVELNDRKMGLYVLKEGYNKGFVKRNFPGQTSGNLYDGGFLRDIDQQLELDAGMGNDWKDLKALATACQIGDREKRYQEVNKLLNVDLFLKNTILQIIGCDWDGYVRNRNNYRVYIPKDGKAVFIPHGMDQMFSNPQESLWPGWGGLAARAILEHPEGKKRALAMFKEVMDKHFTPEFLKQIEPHVTRTKNDLAAINKDWARNFEAQSKGTLDRVKQRMEYINKELPKIK